MSDTAIIAILAGYAVAWVAGCWILGRLVASSLEAGWRRRVAPILNTSAACWEDDHCACVMSGCECVCHTTRRFHEETGDPV